MFALRRVAARAVFTQPARQLSTLRPIPSRTSTLRIETPALNRSFHQSLKWLAAEEQKKEASPAEAQTSGETVTTEPSAEEQKEIREESIATPDVVEAAKETAQKTQENVEETASKVQEAASNAAQTARDFTVKAAQSVSNAASGATFPPRDSGASIGASSRDVKPSRILYIGNLFFEVTAPQLEAEFGKYGDVTNSRVVTDNRGNSKGFAYVELATQDAADRAVRELDQKVFQGRRMAVQYHVRREPRNLRASRDPNPPSKTLFIGNMSYQMSDRDLNGMSSLENVYFGQVGANTFSDLFREIRNVLDVRVAIDRRTGQPRGFAHADFIDVESAQQAKEHLEKKEVYGRQLRVDYSQSSSRERTM